MVVDRRHHLDGYEAGINGADWERHHSWAADLDNGDHRVVDLLIKKTIF